MTTDTSGSTRGDLAFAIYEALGITNPSSSGQFGDSGPYLDGITSTLSDLGITNGVGGGQFGTMQQTNRGQAFTMIARALGLADANTSIEDASQALVDAGIVKGFNDGTLGLDQPLQRNHLQLLMDRIGPELDKELPGGGTYRDSVIGKVDQARDEATARNDPAFAAFLQQQGVRIGEIDDEIALRQELFAEDARRRSDTYQRATDQAIGGVQTDFENRGLFRSGSRLQKEGDTRERIGYQQEQESYHAQRAHEEQQRALENRRSEYQRALDEARLGSQTDSATTVIEEPYN